MQSIRGDLRRDPLPLAVDLGRHRAWQFGRGDAGAIRPVVDVGVVFHDVYQLVDAIGGQILATRIDLAEAIVRPEIEIIEGDLVLGSEYLQDQVVADVLPTSEAISRRLKYN